MNQRTLAIAVVLFCLASGCAMIVVGAAVEMALNGILIGFGVFMLVVSTGLLYYASKLSNTSSPEPKKNTEVEDLEQGNANRVDQQLIEERMQSLYTFKILILGTVLFWFLGPHVLPQVLESPASRPW